MTQPLKFSEREEKHIETLSQALRKLKFDMGPTGDDNI